MPVLARWIIKTAFVFLGIALALGILLAAGPLWNSPPLLTDLFPGYIHILTVGWLTLLIFGVAYWMFPKFTPARPHGDERWNWAAYIALSTGLVLRLVAEPLTDLLPSSFPGGLLVLSALLQWLGGMVFMANLWKRVKVK